MAYNGTMITPWDRGTAADGDLFYAEFNRIYENFEYFKNRELPVGTIIMYDGTGWQDDVTLPGWYACIPENAGQGCPDMTDRFVMGKAVSGSGTTGGQNSVTLVEANLPAHFHTINHNHPAKTSSENGNHRHPIKSHNGGSGSGYNDDQASSWASLVYTNYAGSHTHSVDLNNYTGNSGSTGSDTSFDNRPLYYSMIFIRRCV